RSTAHALQVLVNGLDAASPPDDMFSLDAAPPEETIYTALRRGSFDSAIRRGFYGVHYVPSSSRITELTPRLADRLVLHRALPRTAFPGVVIVDTKRDLGTATQKAIAASDLNLDPRAALAPLFTSRPIFHLIGKWGRPRPSARVVLSMLDLRIKYQSAVCTDVLGLLVARSRHLGLPLFQSFIARSPKVQALATNPEGRTYSILNEASRTSVHDQMSELAEELLELLESLPAAGPHRPDAIASSGSPTEHDDLVAHLRLCNPQAGFAMPLDTDKPLCIRHFPFFVGRSDPAVLNDLAISDLRPWQVSRRHAHLIRRDGRIGVMDLGSRLGTWVDGRQLGGPTADPGPAYFRPNGGELILGQRRRSPYVFEVTVSTAAVVQSTRETARVHPLHAAALAAAAS